MTESKGANADHPVHDLVSTRWSPYAFDPRPVSTTDLRSLFEAARWAASSYNEQPWRYVVATRDDATHYARLLECLAEANRVWAKAAPVLAIGIVSHIFERNGKANRAAVHDLGLASANLTLEATARGIAVHQMIGFDPEKARANFGIPVDFEAWTALAIGYRGDPAALPENLRDRDAAPRTRRPLDAFVFGPRWGAASAALK